jgi:hypothetical protein
MITRRNALLGLGATLFAAPAIVHASNIMKVRNRLITPYPFVFSCWIKPTGYQAIPFGEPMDNGWYRISRQMNAYDGETIPLIVPAGNHIYGIQCEWDPPFKVAKGVKFVLRDTNGDIPGGVLL